MYIYTLRSAILMIFILLLQNHNHFAALKGIKEVGNSHSGV